MQLALKYRPKSFAEVIGQEVIISVLSRQIATKTFKNCYLFCGPSGCGKTTVARIFSNEVNGGQSNPKEINAASNNGIDDIRKISQMALQSSLDSDYQVFIIDECHQLTRAAWDAALKLIEEPPEATIFIFCTTNPSKIPETIQSRVQRFDFRRVSADIITDRLEFICNEELDISYDRQALRSIAFSSGGNVRDAIKMLDMCVNTGNNLTESLVNDIIGKISTKTVVDFCRYLYAKDSEHVLNIYEAISKFTNTLAIYDEIYGIAVDLCLYNKTKNKSIVSIYDDILIDLDTTTLVNRLSYYRPYVDDKSALVFLKIIIMEMLYGS